MEPSCGLATKETCRYWKLGSQCGSTERCWGPGFRSPGRGWIEGVLCGNVFLMLLEVSRVVISWLILLPASSCFLAGPCAALLLLCAVMQVGNPVTRTPMSHCLHTLATQVTTVLQPQVLCDLATRHTPTGSSGATGLPQGRDSPHFLCSHHAGT